MIMDLVPIEPTPEFDVLVKVWIVLFGRSGSSSVSGICWQSLGSRLSYWNSSSSHIRCCMTSISHTSQASHCLLPSMMGSGFLNTD